MTMREKKPIIAARPFHLSAFAVKGPKLRASVDSFALKIGTKDAYVKIWTEATNHTIPVALGPNTWSTDERPVSFSTTMAHTKPTIACIYKMRYIRTILPAVCQ